MDTKCIKPFDPNDPLAYYSLNKFIRYVSHVRREDYVQDYVQVIPGRESRLAYLLNAFVQSAQN